MTVGRLRFRILKINLFTGNTEIEDLPEKMVIRFVGGASLGARYLYENLTIDLQPLSPANPLLFITGPLTGTIGPAVGRSVICAKSPATALWGESNIGGQFGTGLRSAGFDGLLVEGKADSPVYILIRDGVIQIREADHLWGNADTYQTQEMIRSECDDKRLKIAAIGAAGERQLPFASILTGHGRVAGRTGMGAVMGSKNLKAIALHGTRPVLQITSEEFGKKRRAVNLALRDDNMTRAAREYGTAGAADYFDYLGSMPKRYFSSGVMDSVDPISGTTMAETILTGSSTCHGCVIACGRVVKLADGAKRKGPEYETIAGFGPNLGLSDLASITHLGELCDSYGMDTISVSNCIGLATYLFEAGILSLQDTGGEVLNWGNAEAVERLVHMIVRREGLGGVLAEGAQKAADYFGVPEKAAVVNGLEVAYHDPRGVSGMALVYATSPRGACHNQSDYFMVDAFMHTEQDLGIKRYDRHAGAEKAANVARHQDWRTVNNALVMCLFANVPPLDVCELLNLATGWQLSLNDLLLAGERGWTIKRLINIRLGLRAKDDRLPPHLLLPLPDGGAQGYVPPMDDMLRSYYLARRWDLESGHPGEDLIRDLSLEEFID